MRFARVAAMVLAASVFLIVALGPSVSVSAAEYSGEVSSTWPDTAALCVDLPLKRSRHVSRLCLGNLTIKWRMGEFGGSPLVSTSSSWDRQPAIWLRGDEGNAHGRPLGSFSPAVQDAFGEIALTGLDLAVAVLPKGGAAAVGIGLLIDPGTLADAGADFPKNMPSAFDWDTFLVDMPEGDACAYSKTADGKPVYLPGPVGKSILADGFQLANLQICDASFAGLVGLNAALERACEAWASETERTKCRQNKTAGKSPPRPREKPRIAVTRMKETGKPEAPKSNLERLLAGVETPDEEPSSEITPAKEEEREKKKPGLEARVSDVETEDKPPARKQSGQTAQEPDGKTTSNGGAQAFEIAGDWLDPECVDVACLGSYRLEIKKDGTARYFFTNWGKVRVERGTWKQTGVGTYHISLTNRDGETIVTELAVAGPNRVKWHYDKLQQKRSYHRRIRDQRVKLNGVWIECTDNGCNDDWRLTIHDDGSAERRSDEVSPNYFITGTGRLEPLTEGRYRIVGALKMDITVKDPNTLATERKNSFGRTFQSTYVRKDKIALPEEKVADTPPAEEKKKHGGAENSMINDNPDSPPAGAAPRPTAPDDPQKQKASNKGGLDALLSEVEAGDAGAADSGDDIIRQPSGQTNEPLVIRQGTACSSLESVEAANECMRKHDESQRAKGSSGSGGGGKDKTQ